MCHFYGICHVVAGWSLASHTRPLLHIRHPSRTREECADGELLMWSSAECFIVLMKGAHCGVTFGFFTV